MTERIKSQGGRPIPMGTTPHRPHPNSIPLHRTGPKLIRQGVWNNSLCPVGLEYILNVLVKTGGEDDDRQHDREHTHDDADNGHSLVGSTPLVRRQHPEEPHNDRGDSSEKAKTAEDAGHTQTKSPAAKRILLVGPVAEPTSGAVATGLLVVRASGVGAHVAHDYSPYW
ncbi:hypothetical protein HMPREF1549_01499 [Actinomyces johnsonii F0510]|uniref:Uncharacterized protein n=1 Tax=Actinomyces johnsonii F0510 TaxID=1227262 RepID=U1RI40_9ACTO|nr:hypothetical protein HMPREF1549_01499 [Actinomyces johnsonii F0510]